jgi:hypothetical protein
MVGMRRSGAALASVLWLATGCSQSSSSPSSRGNAGLPGTRFTISVRGETAYLDPLTATTVMLPAGGLVTGPGGIACGISGGVASTSCKAAFPWNDPPLTVTLTATPDVAGGFSYFGFAGACADSGPCVVAVTADRFVAVRFGRTPASLGSHSNFSDPTVHGPKYRAWQAGEPGALDCSACHGGAALLGQGIAPSCAQCHPWPLVTPGTVLTWDQGNWDEKVWQ